MSQNSPTFATSSYASFSSTSTINGQTTGSRQIHHTCTDPSGTTVKSASQNMGEPIVQESRQYDNQGREIQSGAGEASSRNRVEDVSDAEQAARDREYEERIEEEYAKREGGA